MKRQRLLCVLALGLSFLYWVGCGAPESTDGSAVTESTPVEQVQAAWFLEAASERGLVFEQRSGSEDRFLFPEIMPAGVALFDRDGDGDLDVYLVQAGSLRAEGNPDGANQLYDNDGFGRFTNITAGSGAGDLGYGMGVTAGDYDGDGDVDLYVTNFGPDVLLQNQGDGTFRDVTADSGISNPSWGTSAGFLDYDRDGNLDLFVTNYINWSMETEQNCYNAAGMLDYCLPTNYNAHAMDKLFRNLGNGRFEDVTEKAGLNLAFGNGLGVVFNDFDGDDWVDIFVANDMMMNQLWMSRKGEGFVEESLLRGCALDEHGRAKAGMGVSSEDLDNDGDTDLLVVNFSGQTDSYYRNDNGYFTDQTGRIGLGSVSRFYTRFGQGLVDFNNDGRFDLYEANGRAVLHFESPVDDLFADYNCLFVQGEDGRFKEVKPQGGVDGVLLHTSRGVAFGDLDNDGGIDAVVVNKDGPVYLLMNQAPDRGNFARFRVVDDKGRDDLGARVVAVVGEVTLTRFVRSAYSYLSSSDPRVHFGLGAATALADVTVTWSDGTTERFGDFQPDGTEIVLRRGGGERG